MARIRLIVAWALFAAWVGWLGWQCATRGRFPVVSRLQFMAANVAVVAELTADAAASERPKSIVTVKEVIWPENANRGLVGRELTLANLPGCDHFKGSGRYILALTGSGEGPYQIAEPPRAPLRKFDLKPMIYPDQPIVREQIRRIVPR